MRVRQYFLLLELTDPAVTAFFWSVRSILSGSRVLSPIHVTLRGPYESEDSKHDALEAARKQLLGDVLQIGDVGRFSNRNEEVVYFKVNSPNLQAASWKRDYPVARYGFEPHISVYRGEDSEFADAAAQFLASRNIQVNCAEYRIVWHETTQPNLFAPREPAVGEMISLQESMRLNSGVLDDLTELAYAYRTSQSAQYPHPRR